MNKLEANLALFSITLCWGCQYIFYKNVPASVSTFAFLTLTNLIGSILLCAIFFKELKKINKTILIKSAILSVLLISFNALILMGTQLLPASTAAFASTLYVVIVPVILFFMKKPLTISNILGIIGTVGGLFYITEINLSQGLELGIIYILVADIVFALYIIMLDVLSKAINPALLSVLQMIFCTILSFFIWFSENPKTFFSLEYTPAFLGSVFIIGVFMKAYSTVMQSYAQRYVTPMNAVLVFSTESGFALLGAFFIPMAMGGVSEPLTGPKILGCVMIILSIVVSEIDLVNKIKNVLFNKENLSLVKNKFTLKNILIFLGMVLIYIAVDVPFRVLNLLEGIDAVGPSNILPVIYGSMFGVVGAVATFCGSLLADIMGGNFTSFSGYKAVGVFIITILIYCLWYFDNKKIPINLKSKPTVIRFLAVNEIAICIGSFIISMGASLETGKDFLSLYFIIIAHFTFWSLVFGAPALIVFLSIFVIKPFTPKDMQKIINHEHEFSTNIINKTEFIGDVIDQVMMYCGSNKIDGQKTYYITLCIEEILVRIIDNAFIDDLEHSINVCVNFTDVVAINITDDGIFFDPMFRAKKVKTDDIDMDALGITMVEQMAVKTSHKYRDGKNIMLINI